MNTYRRMGILEVTHDITESFGVGLFPQHLESHTPQIGVGIVQCGQKRGVHLLPIDPFKGIECLDPITARFTLECSQNLTHFLSCFQAIKGLGSSNSDTGIGIAKCGFQFFLALSEHQKHFPLRPLAATANAAGQGHQ
ncbi:MAG: hypothetical protein A2091_10380 [Desulfuromonadales bacterium GWD2_61_12]|nr:MAG: hypothetical protein A2005_06840 [Desulfuromonadales bacterium GWC2_61_20]OGR36269.1 MAG: hypothetical protein A2091_10380 [Desulfuromonadales bacterium GWD2_61_12]